MEPAKIVLRALATFCGYGALFGFVCSWICPEAYTVMRTNYFGSLSIPWLGIPWGMYDFLIFAAVVGIGTALAAHVGHRPTVKAFFFTRPFLFVAAITAVVGTVGGFLGRNIVIAGEYEQWLPPERHAVYRGTWWALLTSQAVMTIGGATLAIWTWRKRMFFEQLVLKGEIGGAKIPKE